MGTPFISLLEPSSLDGYNPSLPSTSPQQPAHIPPTFRDAMRVREEVFVKGQGFPLELEFDVDDARSLHWVIYASINKKVCDEATGEPLVPQQSVTETTPIGTIRVVPFPHPPHPPDGGEYVNAVLQPLRGLEAKHGQDGTTGNDGDISIGGVGLGNIKGADNASAGNGNEATTAETVPSTSTTSVSDGSRKGSDALSLLSSAPTTGEDMVWVDRATDMHNGQEPYVKLGRLAVLSDFRGHGIAAQLWTTAKTWLQQNPTYFNPSVKQMGMDRLSAGTPAEIPKWDGLVCVHAQEEVVKLYERWGFQVDKGMGRWFEEGVPHVGMFQRLEITRSTDPKV
ncbi:acetyltransferase [Xylariaceae sp. FL0255]|nr:acetyltransferase [Xylariaceae sp. FL0255]